MFEVRMTPLAAARLSLAVFAVLLAAHVAVVVLRIEFARDYVYGLALRFDFARSAGVPDWFTGVLFLAASLASFLCAAMAAKFERWQARYWTALGVLLLYCSFDDIAAVHDLVAGWLLGDTTDFSAWTLIYAPAAIALALAFSPLLHRLPRSTAVALVAAGLTFVFGAIVLEVASVRIAEGIAGAPAAAMTGDQWIAVKTSWVYAVVTTLAESFEMLGLMLYIVAVLGYLSRRGVSFRVSFSRSPADG